MAKAPTTAQRKAQQQRQAYDQMMAEKARRAAATAEKTK